MFQIFNQMDRHGEEMLIAAFQPTKYEAIFS
jgi:hypothetical protein